MSHFLLKTEPSEYSIDDLRRDKVTSWFGVRSYQARNIIRDDIKVGDFCIIYHSSCAVPSAVGIGKVIKEAYPDLVQFDATSDYFDASSKKESPRWFAFEVTFIEKFQAPLSLSAMRTIKELKDMRLLATGNRLSVMPITEKHFQTISGQQ